MLMLLDESLRLTLSMKTIQKITKSIMIKTSCVRVGATERDYLSKS